MLFALLFAFLTCCSALKVITETPRSQWQQKQTNASFEGDGSNTTRNAQGEKYQGYIPQDQGGNYGDLVHLKREVYDVLLLREVVVNSKYNQDTILELETKVGSRITSVYVLNFGRERGYVEEITTRGNYVYVRVAIRAYYEIRMLVDVYGFVWVNKNDGFLLKRQVIKVKSPKSAQQSHW